MPLDTALAMKVWYRYTWCRDNGHLRFVEKADKCDRFFQGDQWSDADKGLLEANRRPALTVNKILATVGNVMGEQIQNRNEISFRPRGAANTETADALTKVFKQISDNNQLDWQRSEMFADGVITSRGFLDVRVEFDDAMQGEVKIRNLNSKNVIIDPDADEYDPDGWNEVFVTKWMTADDIAIYYSREDAEQLRNREQSFFPYGYDSIERNRDRFGERLLPMFTGPYDQSSVLRNIRVIERQHRQNDMQKHFILPSTGDMRPVPDGWDREKIAFVREKYGFEVTRKLVKRIRWTVIADNHRLHDDWSPYKHFTVVPYFPYLRKGKTIGLVENLISPQEMLNKTLSQELHVINTTANSGWVVKNGALTSMSIEELEQRGAQTGLVIEVNDMDALEKIQPNQVPSGLDRLSYKAEEHIKGISGVNDSMMGMDREDVAAKAIQTKRQAGSTTLVKPFDNMVRTDSILARNVLDLVQTFYTEERILTITKDKLTGEHDQFTINQVTPEGEVVNDLTLGEYDVVTTSVPVRETLEDSQFEQAVALRELGVNIPESVLIENSRLMNKRQIIEKMEAAANSPEAQQQAQIAAAAQEAELAKTQAEAQAKGADAGLKQAKTQKELAGIEQKDAELQLSARQNAPEAQMLEMQMKQQEHEQGMQHEQEMHMMKIQAEQQKQAMEQQKQAQQMRLQEQEAAERAKQERIDRAMGVKSPPPPTAAPGETK